MGDADRWAYVAYLGHGDDPIRAHQADYVAEDEDRSEVEQRIVTWNSGEVDTDE